MIDSGIDSIEFDSAGNVTYPDNIDRVILAHKSQLQEMFRGKVSISEGTYLLKPCKETPGILGIHYKVIPLSNSQDQNEMIDISTKLLNITLRPDDARVVVFTTAYNMLSLSELDDDKVRNECHSFLKKFLAIDDNAAHHNNDSFFSATDSIIYYELTSSDGHFEYSDVIRDLESVLAERTAFLNS